VRWLSCWPCVSPVPISTISKHSTIIHGWSHQALPVPAIHKSHGAKDYLVALRAFKYRGVAFLYYFGVFVPQYKRDRYESARKWVYIALMDCKDESLSGQRLSKDHRWRIAEITWVLGSENQKNKQKKPTSPNVVWEASAMTVPVPWPDEWAELKRRSTNVQHASGNLKDLERFCMEEWSLIYCQLFSKLIRHYRRRLRAVILAKGDCKKYLIKGCQ